MPVISFIPKRYKDGFEKIASMPDEDFHELSEGLSLTSLVSSTNKLAIKISESKKLDSDILNDIFESIGSLVSYIEDEKDNKEIEEIVEDLSRVAIENGIVKEDQEENFKARALFLFQNQHIYFASKTEELTSEYANIYLNSEIATDIRPIFSRNVEEAPKGAIITHNLHLHYRVHREGDHKDIYLALDSNDINSMIEVLKRAQKKEISLSQIFNKSGITNLNE